MLMSVVESIISGANAKVADQANGIILADLESARQSAQDRLTNVQAELDEITTEITSRTATTVEPETPTEETVETPAEEAAEPSQG